MQFPLVHTELIHHPVDHNQIEHVRKSVPPIEINVKKNKLKSNFLLNYIRFV